MIQSIFTLIYCRWQERWNTCWVSLPEHGQHPIIEPDKEDQITLQVPDSPTQPTIFGNECHIYKGWFRKLVAVVMVMTVTEISNLDLIIFMESFFSLTLTRCRFGWYLPIFSMNYNLFLLKITVQALY